MNPFPFQFSWLQIRSSSLWFRGLAGSRTLNMSVVGASLCGNGGSRHLESKTMHIICSDFRCTHTATRIRCMQTDTGYLPFSPPPLFLPYRLPKSCPLTRCVFRNNQMNKMQRPWGITLRDPISWRLVTWLNFLKQRAKLRKLNWFLFACFTTLCSVLPLLFCDIIIHHSWIALCQHYSSTHHV